MSWGSCVSPDNKPNNHLVEFMKSLALALALGFAVSGTAMAQQPTVAQKAGEAATQAIGKFLPQTPAPAAQPVKATTLVNINKATAAELDQLPSIGEARAKAIVSGRPYKTVQELLDRKVLPKDSFETIKDKVSVR
jgi:competence protein ComEA